MTTTGSAANAGVPRQKMEFVYDSQGRRVAKTVSTSTNGTSWSFSSSRRYLYDGWNLIAEYSAPDATSTALTLEASHVWGLDLSGSMQGAGGVGGLLSVSSLITSNPITYNTHFPAYDGNGNISAWIGSTGDIMARMDYSPFGRLITQYKFTDSITLARLNFGFSTKMTDPESGLLYYGYRYYDTVAGRWLGRDPIGEKGGVNLYGFVENAVANLFDIIGLRDQFQDGDVDQYLEDQKKLEIIERELAKQRSKRTAACCDSKKIRDGRKELLTRFKRLKGVFEKVGRSKGASTYDIDHGKASKLLSCHNINSDLLAGLYGFTDLIRDLEGNEVGPESDERGFPSCWQCVLEHRNSEKFDPKFVDGVLPWSFQLTSIRDHHFVVCKAYDKDGKLADEVLFDLWDPNAKNGKDPGETRGAYPNLEDIDSRFPLPKCQ